MFCLMLFYCVLTNISLSSYFQPDFWFIRSVCFMDKKNEVLNLWTIIGLIAAVAAVVASVTTAMIVLKKKEKEERELQEYIDYSIQ